MVEKLLHRRVTRKLLGFLSAFCQYDPREYNKIMSYERWKKEGMPKEKGLRGHSNPKQGALWWAKLVAGVYIYINTKLLILLYWQYKYDINDFKLQQLAKAGNISDPEGSAQINLKRVDEIQNIKMNLNQSRRIIKQLGNPYSEMHFVFPCACLIVMYLTYCVYMHLIIAPRVGITRHFDLYFIRIILSQDLETIQCRRLVRRKADQLRDSSRNFMSNQFLRTNGILKDLKLTHKYQNECPINEPARGSRLHNQFEAHLYACDQMREMLKTRELHPVNRSTEWVNDKSRQFATMVISNLIYSFIFDSLVLYGLPTYLGYFRIETVMDLVTFIEFWILFEISVIATTMAVPLLNVNVKDQRKYMTWLVDRVEQCVRENDELFAYESAITKAHALINRNLMKVLIEFEVFLAQFKPIQQSFSFIATSASAIVLVIPLMLRVHKPYCHYEVYSLGLYFCLFVVVSSDGFTIPMCQSSIGSKRLYARMVSLLCQMIEFDSFCGTKRQQVSWCDQHLIWKLRNIMGDSQKFTRQFAAQLLPFVPLTVQNLIRIHYWCLLLALTFLNSKGHWSKLLADRWLDDPFRLLESTSMEPS